MFTVNVSLASTAEYSSEAAESIKDLNPNAADILITSVITSMVTDLGVVAPTASGLLTYYDGDKNSTHSVDGYFVAPKKFDGNDHEEHRISMTYGGHVETYAGANTFAIPGIYKILDFIYKNYSSLPLKILLEFPGQGLVKKAGEFIVKNPKKSMAIGTGILGLDDARKDYLSGKRFVNTKTIASTLKGLPNFIKGRRNMVQTNTTGTGNQVVDVSGSDVEDKIKSSKDKSTTKYLDKYLKDKRKRLDKEMN